MTTGPKFSRTLLVATLCFTVSGCGSDTGTPSPPVEGSEPPPTETGQPVVPPEEQPADTGGQQPDPNQPDPNQPDPNQPDPNQPDPNQPDPNQPDPDPNQPDPNQPDPDPNDPDPNDPVSGKPEPQQLDEPIFFGTTLDPAEVMTTSRALAESQVDPSASNYRATGDQHRTYHFDETNRDEPFRLYVPTDWDGTSELPMVMFLHGAGSNENTYVDQNNKLMLNLAQEHGFLLVSAMGADGAYGNFLRLSAPFGNQAGAEELMAAVTPDSERTNELSERDVINVVELILEEYPIDQSAMFLTGHSMGSGGTWYIGGKYAVYWRAIAPMSGPFVQETGYPWEHLSDVSILVTEGTQTPSLEGSQLLGSWLSSNGFDSEYLEVNSDHGGMVPLVLPNVFDYFAARVN